MWGWNEAAINLTHCPLENSCIVIWLCKHWFIWELVAWRHQAITSTNDELISMRWGGFHLWAVSQQMWKKILEIIATPRRGQWVNKQVLCHEGEDVFLIVFFLEYFIKLICLWMVYVILHKSCSGILVIIPLQNKNLYFNQFVIISYSIEWNGNAYKYITCDFASFKCVKSFPCFTKGVVNI